MPTWIVAILQWAVGQLLQRIKPEDVKKEVAVLVEMLDAAVQSAEKNVKGPFEGVADQVAEAFHDACVVVVAALKK